MGIVGQLLTLPLAPVRGFGWVVRQVTEVAEREYYDPAPVYAALRSLEEELMSGRIGQAEFDRREDELLDRLDEIERFRRGAAP
ncbi:gas vesicle protein GvpG [Streptomyces sp. LP05-1]|uniref:Gas vesicle protein GvpG n=1 Tax=Streptomyces pyxinae TaxID=2970734 RepID=A0ABT2CM84_9ACTN|nr:gas vesicle protein GvpG [Streptomyces sp. LP05-1]MCS0638534.1 gas vesicle protein GvpG [Streptomyces sp. LP05-1]